MGVGGRRGGCLCLGVTFSAGGGLKGNNGGKDGGKGRESWREKEKGQKKWKWLKKKEKKRKRNCQCNISKKGQTGQETGMRLHNCSCY